MCIRDSYGSLWSVMTAKEKGYFDEEGITVKLVEFQDGPNIIAALESGSIDVGYIGQGAHKLCVNGQATIFALSHISNGDAPVSYTHLDVYKRQELAGAEEFYAAVCGRKPRKL